MKKSDKREKYIYVRGYKRKIRKHVTRHGKKYVRFFIFSLLLILFGVIEDILAITLTGSDIAISTIFKWESMTLIVGVAVIFTLIAEFTEELFAGRKPREIIRKTAKAIREEEKLIENKLKRNKKKKIKRK